MPAIARVSDQTNHPGLIAGPGVSSVLVAGLPVAVLGDNHACAFPSGNPPSPVAKGSTVVLVAGRPVARVGDVVGCGAQVIVGAFTVEVGG
jgi:uncharacterized Zn-binding protein involved in type VI secretion